MAERKDCHALISRFEKMYKERVGPIIINRHTERWTADSLLESMDRQDLYKAMDYYFKINPRPTWAIFARRADELLAACRNAEADAEQRAVQREKLRRVINES